MAIKIIPALFDIHKKDARNLSDVLTEKIVDVTITSPPYFDLKDYGYKEQIGFGQKYEPYLQDLKKVFKNVYDCTKDNGTLWVIIDSYRRENEVIPLPFDFSNKLKEVGWKLQEVIIWVKDKTVPWSHHGQMRNLFEYILLFSKSDKYNFFIDEVRDFESLKKWWVKYPERYNPKGKTPDGIWHFDIPIQGSWGKGYIKHFCPLPEEMIAQILKISTKEGDVVLDPFAGSGAVLAKADNMNRKYIGFELNGEYINMFHNYLKETTKKNQKKYETQKLNNLSQKEFNNLIIKLRGLKYAKTIIKKIPTALAKNISKIYVEKTTGKITQNNAICCYKYVIFSETEADISLIKAIQEAITIRPLSKFGIQPVFIFQHNRKKFIQSIGENSKVFSYTDKVTHKFSKESRGHDIFDLSKSNMIISKIKVELNEKDYE